MGLIHDQYEEAHGRVVLPLRTAAGVPLTFADLLECRVRLTDHHTKTVLNNRTGTTPMGPNVAADGSAIVWTPQPADNVIVDRALGFELHSLRVDYVYGTQVGRYSALLRVQNLAIGDVDIPEPPAPGAPTWSFFVPPAGARPGRVFTLASVPVAVEVFYQGAALLLSDPPGIGEFARAGATITTGFDVQPGEALWAHVLA